MIPTYNCANYLRETLASVLAQDPGPDVMQIEVVDDHSTADEPGAVVEEMGRGRIRFFQQPRNLGITGNFETCLQRSRGRLIHLLHGDDYVLPGFYSTMQRAFVDNPAIGAAFCRHVFLFLTDLVVGGRVAPDHSQALSPLEQPESGVLRNGLERIASEQRIMTPSIVVRREVYETLGGFDSRLLCSEDWEMWVRIVARYPIWYEVEPLAVYRMHSASNTGRHLRHAEHLRYTREAIQIFTAHLPHEVAAKLSDTAREAYALSALNMAYTMLQTRRVGPALSHAREALRLRSSLRVTRRLVGLIARAAVSWTRSLLASHGTPR